MLMCCSYWIQEESGTYIINYNHAQHTSSSAYRPQPGKGESPTRPGGLKGGPEVDTPAHTLP